VESPSRRNWLPCRELGALLRAVAIFDIVRASVFSYRPP
jgi:hypothetical protein